MQEKTIPSKKKEVQKQNTRRGKPKRTPVVNKADTQGGATSVHVSFRD